MARIHLYGSVLAAALMLAATGPAQADSPIGRIKTATGTVAIDHGGDHKTAAIGDAVYQSDKVTTGPGSSAGITFVDDSMMSLGANSALTLDRFVFDPTTNAGGFDSTLKAGTMLVKSGKIVKQTPESMTVHTPIGILGVRGTEFLVRATDDAADPPK